MISYLRKIKQLISNPKCMDCKWYDDSGFTGKLDSTGLYHEFGLCENPKTRSRYSSIQRKYGFFISFLVGKSCSKYGRFFEKK